MSTIIELQVYDIDPCRWVIPDVSRQNSSSDAPPLMKRPPLSLKMFGANHPVMLRHIQDEERSQTHSCESLTRHALYVYRNVDAHLCNHCCRGKAIRITYYECVSEASGIQHTMRMRHIVNCGLSHCIVFFHIIPQTSRLRKKNHWTWNVFRFSLQLLSEAFFILRRTERDMIKKYIGVHVE